MTIEFLKALLHPRSISLVCICIGMCVDIWGRLTGRPVVSRNAFIFSVTIFALYVYLDAAGYMP